MKNFIFGILTTIGALVIGNKIYDRGYDDAKKETKKEIQTDVKSSKDKKAK